MKIATKHWQIDNSILYVSHANLFSKLGTYSQDRKKILSGFSATVILPNHSDPEFCPPHHHDHFQIFYVNTPVICRHMIANDKVFHGTGDVTVIPPANNHHISVLNSSENAGYMFDFTSKYLHEIAPPAIRSFLFDWAYLLRWLRGGDTRALTFTLSESERRKADRLSQMLFELELTVRRQESFDGKSFSDGFLPMVYSCANDLMRVLRKAFYAGCTEQEKAAFSKYRPILLSAAEYINRNLQKQIKLDELCAHVGLRPTRFSEIFSGAMGLTINDFINFTRISRARSVISSTALPLNEIAALCGFTNQTHFGRVFKEFTGCSPRTYRTEYAFELE